MKERFTDKLPVTIMYAIVVLFTAACLFPLLMALSVSFSDERTVSLNGYSLFPQKLSLDTYRFLFQQMGSVITSSYLISISVTVVGTLLALAITSAYAYVTTVAGFKFGRFLLFFAFFTMLFSGGMLPWYIMCTRYYRLRNSLFALILPYLMNVFNMYLLRNYMKTVPAEIAESAKIDGAGHFTIFFRLVLPLSQVGLVTIGLFYALGYWNDWYLSLMLINKSQLYPVQYLLYQMMSNLQFLSQSASRAAAQHVALPLLTVRMALTCVAIGPIVFAFPFVQGYFVKGITLGSLKG